MKSFAVVLMLAGIGYAWYAIPTPLPKRHLAAEGTYFLREYHSLKTDHGLVGWTPGQELHTVLKAPFVSGCLTVTDGTLADVLPESLLTRDIEDAGALRLADRRTEEETRHQIASVTARIDANKLNDQISNAGDISRHNATMVAASTVGTYSSRLNEPRTAVGFGSVGYIGYPVYVGGGGPAPVVVSAPRANPSGVAAGTTAAQQIQAAMSASARQRMQDANARALAPTPAPAHTSW